VAGLKAIGVWQWGGKVVWVWYAMAVTLTLLTCCSLSQTTAPADS
jgi:hypothetical protein